MRLYLIISTIIISLFGCNKNTGNRKVAEKPFSNDIYLKNIPDSFRHVASVLDTVFQNDQKYRSVSNPKLYSDHVKEQSILDAANLKIVTSVLDKYGWPGIYNVGLKASIALEMVMVHSDPATKQKYYPSMLTALKKGKISYGNYSLFEDKLNVQMNRYQYYGSQVKYQSNRDVVVLPVFEPDSLDSRRKMMHLESMSEYLKKNFNSKWDLEEYKKELPDLLKLYPISDSLSFHTVE